MKNKLAFLLFLVAIGAAGQLTPKKFKSNFLSFRSAQSTPPNSLYSFSTFTEVYQPIVGTSISSGQQWDELDFVMPVGFNFKLYNKQNDSISIFGGSVVSFDDINNANSIAALSPFYEDLCDRAWDSTSFEGKTGGLSDISYAVSGSAGNRICIIQVSNAGFFGEIDSAGTSTSFVNFQIWLYETSNKIELHFGNCNIQNPNVNLANSSAGFICGLANITNAISFVGTGNLLKGPNANPTMVGFDPGNPFADAVSYQIQSGRVYQFVNTSYNGVGLPTQEKHAALRLFPNPATNTLMIDHSGIDVSDLSAELFDITGKMVLTVHGKDIITLDAVASGVYLVRITAGGSVYNHKLLVSEK